MLSNTDNNIVYVNPAFLTMIGGKSDALIGKSTHVFNESMVSLFESQQMNNISFITTEETEELIYLSRPSSRILFQGCAP